jgi:FkbM family methyltransferase
MHPRLRNLVEHVLSKAGPLSFALLPIDIRARILERLVRDMIARIDIGEKEILMYTPFPQVTWRATSFFTKERDTIAWINSFKEGSVFWDIGANVGVYSLYAATKRRAIVLAFEPAAPNFYLLTQNVWLNKLHNCIQTYPVALSGRTELGMLNLSSGQIGAALHQFGCGGEISPYADRASGFQMHAALGITIDNFIQKFCPPFPEHLKIDVDGLELAILSGAALTLKNPRLKTVLVELRTEEGDQAEATEVLNNAGFIMMSQGDLQSDGVHHAVNNLFIRQGC